MKHRELESFEDAVEHRNAPHPIFKTFVADIYESGNLEPQSVFVYPTYLDGTVLDCEIKMMILVNPSAIRDDVEAALYSEYPELTLGNLKFYLAPSGYSV